MPLDNQKPLEEQSHRLTQFVIGNQQYDFNVLFYGIFIQPAAFSAFTIEIFRPLTLKKIVNTFLDDFFIQPQIKQILFQVLDKYHQIFLKESIKLFQIYHVFFLTPTRTYFKLL